MELFASRLPRNLSQAPGTLTSMRITDTQTAASPKTTATTETGATDPTEVFADPVTYLARFGIEAHLVGEARSELATAA